MSLFMIEKQVSTLYRPICIGSYDEYEKDLSICIGRNLKHIRREMGWNQSSIAGIMSVSPSQYRKYECGEDLISTQKAMSFSLTSGVPYQYLFWKSGCHDLLEKSILDMRLIKLQSCISFFSKTQFLDLLDFLGSVLGADVAQSSIVFDEVKKTDTYSEKPDYDYQIVANNIKAFRSIIGFSQEELSAKLGVSTNTISNYESLSKRTKISIRVALRFWLMSGISPVFLTYGTSFFLRSRIVNMRLILLSKIFSNLESRDLDHILDMLRGYYQFKNH